MALGHQNKNSTNPLIVLKFTDKDKDKKKVPPHFAVFRKNADGKYVNEGEKHTRVSGNLYRLDIKENEWQGDKYHTVAVFLKDGEEAYSLDFRFTIASRGLFNTLLSLESFDNISITTYEGKNGYPAIGVWQNDKMVKWKFKLDELPAPETVKFKGKEMNDYTKVDDFFVKELSVLAGKLGAGKKTRKQTEATPAPEEETLPL